MAVKVAVSALNSCEDVIKCALRIIFHKIESENAHIRAYQRLSF